MTLNNKELKETKNKKNPPVDLSRRRLAIAGLIAAPILSTLPGKPAMAAFAKNNCTVSGNMSGNMSDNVNNVDPCDSYAGGKTPDFWAQNPSEWPMLYAPGTCKTSQAGICLAHKNNGTKFHDKAPNAQSSQPVTFDGSNQIKSNGKSFSLMLVLEGTANLDVYQLDAHAVAALLNAETFGQAVYGYSPNEVIDLYNQYHILQPVALKQTFQYLNELG